jgi:ubiquinone/menaquinone biosynthesis C-methylase UbiE
MTAPSFDPFWREKYAKGHVVRCPYDIVFSFIYRNVPKDKDRSQVSILEVGCGPGNNIWFGAIEGFSMTGIDGSPEAIAYAKNRLFADGLKAALTVGDFTLLPYAERNFDLVIDRGSLTCAGLSQAKKAVLEIYRVLVSGGKFFCNVYSSFHTSATSGRTIEDNLVVETTKGIIESLKHLVITESAGENAEVHAEWRAIVCKAS